MTTRTRLVIAVGLLSQAMVVFASGQALVWEQSYRAGQSDDNGQFMGGSTIVHLVGHKGKLFAGNSYWQDSRNVWYGGKDRSTGWAQVLRLDKSGGRWTVDLEMGPQHLRCEILKSVTFRTDGGGKLLKEPVNLLVACTFNPKQDSVSISMFTRNDATGKWTRSTVFSGPRPKVLDDRATRAIRVHRDKVTGVDRIFLAMASWGFFPVSTMPPPPARFGGTRSPSQGRWKHVPWRSSNPAANSCSRPAEKSIGGMMANRPHTRSFKT